MNICLQSIFFKTVFFKAVADQLEKAGHNVFWTATSLKWRQWLLCRGVSPGRILLLRRDDSAHIDPRTAEHARMIEALEARTGLTVKKIFHMDRVVRQWPWTEAEKYYVYVVQKLNAFFNENAVEVVLGEATLSDEILAALVCQANNIDFYNLCTVRVPGDRFAFFKGYRHAEYERIADDDAAEDYFDRAAELRQRLIDGLKPDYWYWHNKVPRINYSFVARIWTKIREALVEAQTDATVKPLSYHLVRERQYLKPFRWLHLKLMPVFDEPRADESYLLYTLHKQPEASIDVLGADFVNQYELIKGIARQLPHDVMLYVKEHSHCLGDRTRAELMAIKRLPGVRLIDPFADTHTLIKKARAVITVSGTVAFEAGLHGKTAGTFAPMFFNRLSRVHHLRSVDDIGRLLEPRPDAGGLSRDDQRVLADILANSCEGVIGDPLNVPLCMSDDNIDRVAAGCLKLLSALQARKRSGVTR